MKKIFTLIVMALVGLACGMQASAEAYTVYFYNPTDLPTPHVHVWGNSVSCNFPGYEMTWDKNIGLWKLSLDAVPTNFLIAFCENGKLKSQTVDYTVTNNNVYAVGKFENNKYSVVDLGAFDDIDRTLYFQNTLNLPSINMYASTKYGIGDDQTAEKSWTGDWPGIQVPTEQVEGDLYKVTFKAYFQPNTIVFSNNSNDKTEDMGFLNNGVYTGDSKILGTYNYGEHTIYFNNTKGWNSEQLELYIFTKYNSEATEWSGNWPGTTLTKTDRWGVYSYTFTSYLEPTGLIISENGSNNTYKRIDVAFKDGYLYNGSGIVGDSEYVTPEAMKIHFQASTWNTVYVHYWGQIESKWPGVQMTPVQPAAENGMMREQSKLYEAEIPANTTGMLFNNGEGAQTNDFSDISSDLTYLQDGSTTGVEEIEAAEDVEAVYYNLQGVRVANPENGLYIRVAGNKATKVYVR